MDTFEVDLDGRRRRRRHSAQFKQAVVRECLRPGISIPIGLGGANTVLASLPPRLLPQGYCSRSLEWLQRFPTDFSGAWCAMPRELLVASVYSAGGLCHSSLNKRFKRTLSPPSYGLHGKPRASGSRRLTFVIDHKASTNGTPVT